MKKQHFILGTAFTLVVALTAISGASPSLASATATTTVYHMPVSPSSFEVPCANGGAGEIVNFTGYLHVTEHTTFDANGGFHLAWSVNPMGVVGVGEDSGDTYRGVGCTSQSVYVAPDGLPITATYVDNFGVIGTGQAPNLFMKTIDRFTIDANGNVTTAILVSEVRCQ